ncbi:putative bifunctional diguanylate cyclase/phosphodiesterase [Cellvibrio fontiphilus]|uniref:Bifunctional diguanylate cyclase/phosphodiesterase n=1 Tax=Cellvibrio fontiphilus TaxID=1815559 RepID=A0ABV7FCQ2_9GAMM
MGHFFVRRNAGESSPTATASAIGFKLALIYATFSALYILLSDQLLYWLFSDPATITFISTVKGWAFVFLTSVMLYLLVRTQVGMALEASRRQREVNEEKLRAMLLLDSISANSTDAIFAKDLQGRYLLFNREAERVTGKTSSAVLGKDDRAIFSAPQAETVMANDLSVMQQCKTLTFTEVLTTADGDLTYLATKGPLRNDAGEVVGVFGISRDISEMKQAEARIHYLAYFDALTDLPNRSLLTDRLTQCITQTSPDDCQGALILFNVDRFKKINDARGQAIGDNLLKALAERVASVVGNGDTLARMGGDEFAVLVRSHLNNSQPTSHIAMMIVNNIQQVIAAPFVVNGDEIRLTLSLGLTLFPEGNDSADEVIKRADNALHKAKKLGGNQALFFEAEMRNNAEHYFQVERELRQGIARGELQLYLQSQVDANGKLVGAEALVRWLHPQRGLVPPVMFIPVAEDTDLIADIDKWVFEQVCQLLASAPLRERPLRIAVNISPRHFRHSNFVNWIKNTIAYTGVDAGKLTLEITEGLLVDNVNDAIAKMSELTTLGIHFSIDDFGTGYSSLSYLKRLPIHELKIDKMFVQDAPENSGDAVLVETILAVAKHLRLRVVAEGVETEAQANFLNERALVNHQGYLYSKPEPVEQWLVHQLRLGDE